MTSPNRKEIRLTASQLRHDSPKDQFGVLKKFIQSPNEAVALARLMGSRLAEDLNGMLNAARELVRIDQYDIVEIAAPAAKLEWHCAFTNIESFLVRSSATTETGELRHMFTDLSGIWRQAWLHTTSSGDIGTRQYLTEWVES